ncbi:MAG: phosphate signaling complex protein PhoU [Planctomycetota bacterium]
MSRHFLRELEHLKRDVLLMGGMVETAVRRALDAFLDVDSPKAESVIEGDKEVDSLELRIEEECLKLLALYGPTARDLRFVVGVNKITNDLERVGDQAKNIAERSRMREKGEQVPGMEELSEMAQRVLEMLDRSLDAFVGEDANAAREVHRMDDRVDQLLRMLYDKEEGAVRDDPTRFRAALRILSTAKYLERIADHATNVAEDVVYMVEGSVLKHHHH